MNSTALNSGLRILPNFLWPLRLFIMRMALKSVGKRVKFSYDSYFDNFNNVYIGNDVFINIGFQCSNIKKLIIKDRVMFGPNCKFMGDNNDYNFSVENMEPNNLLQDEHSIIIEEDVWIGHGTVFSECSFVSEGCIVGAASVVDNTLQPYSVYTGNPAKFVKPRFKTYSELTQYLEMMKQKCNFQTRYSEEKLKGIYNLK